MHEKSVKNAENYKSIFLKLKKITDRNNETRFF